MNTPSSVSRETFQQFLASAFAVQQSRISRQCLSDIMDLQRSIASGKLDLDGAMGRIVESARNVANASGVAIALLKRDQLFYRAGSGTSAAYIGRHMTASLTVSANTNTNREILRVEDARTDSRIEAAICRQFDANSLLILPIYQDRALAGVLQVLFREAHAFQEHEVSTYRLMAEQIEAAISQVAKLEEKEAFAAQTSALSNALTEDAFPDESFVPPPEFGMLPENEHSLYARWGAVFAAMKELPAFKLSAMLATTITRRAKSLNWPRRLPSSVPATPGQLPASRLRASLRTFAPRAKALTWPNRWRNSVPTAIEELKSVSKRAALFVATFTRQAKHFKWPNRSRTFAVAAVAVVIAFAATMAYRHRGPSGSLESATLPKSAPVNQQPPVPKPLPGKGTSGAYTATIPAKGAGPARTAFKRVRVGPNEVDYLADDVTVRTFSDKVAVKRARVSESRIAHIGNDVTVRYFTVPPTPTRTAAR
jgi:hypothetical protein